MNDPTAGIPRAGLVLLGPRFRAGRDVDHVGGGVGHVGVERGLLRLLPSLNEVGVSGPSEATHVYCDCQVGLGETDDGLDKDSC